MKTILGRILLGGFFLASLAAGIWYYNWTGREQRFVIQPEIKVPPGAGPETNLTGSRKIAMRFHSSHDAQILRGTIYAGKASKTKQEVVVSVCPDQNSKSRDLTNTMRLGDIARTRMAAMRVTARLPQDRLENTTIHLRPELAKVIFNNIHWYSESSPSETLPPKISPPKKALTGYPVNFSLPCALERGKDYWLVIEPGWKMISNRPWWDDYISLLGDKASQRPAVEVNELRYFVIPQTVKATEEPEYGTSCKPTLPLLMTLQSIKLARGNRRERVGTIWAPPGDGEIRAATKFKLNYRVKLFRKFSASTSGDRLEGAIYVTSADPPVRDLIISLAKNKGRDGWLKQEEPRDKADQLDFTSEIRLASTRVTVQPAKKIGEDKNYQRIPFSLYYPGIKAGTNYWLMLEPGWREPDSAYIELPCGQEKSGESFWRIFEREVRFPIFFSESAVAVPGESLWGKQETGKEARLPPPESNTFFLGELELLKKAK